jgi:RNA polymerase sigma factor (sigma-70 family)
MRDESFGAVYAANFDCLLGYALRRVEVAEDAADIVSETFLVAWRRLSDVPPGDEARLWLYGVARRVLANHRRAVGRRDRLGARLRADLAAITPDHAVRVAAETDLRRALSDLGELDREVLELTIWEGLEPREVASVLDIPARTVRTRLSRARARLRERLGDDRLQAGHVPGEPIIATPEGGHTR